MASTDEVVNRNYFERILKMTVYPIDKKFSWFLRNLPKTKNRISSHYIPVHKDRIYVCDGRVLVRIKCLDIPDGVYEWAKIGISVTDIPIEDWVTKYDGEINAVRANRVLIDAENQSLGVACYLTSQGITLNWMDGDGDIIHRLGKETPAFCVHSGGWSSVLLTGLDFELVIRCIDESEFTYKLLK